MSEMRGDRLRVLLVSTRTNDSRFYNGECAYTDGLLAAPPPGVEIAHYEDLIAGGRARRARWVGRLMPRLGRMLGGAFWADSVITDERFDLVHLHGFSGYLGGGLRRSGTPVLLSQSSPELEYLADRQGWTRARMRRFAGAKRLLFRALRIYDPALNLRDARHLTVWSDWARGRYREWGVPDARMSVIPPTVPDARREGAARPTGHDPAAPRFLFVGMDFVRKNGPLLLEAFHRLRGAKPGAHLTVVGGRNSDLDDPARNVRHIPHLPRHRIFEEVYPHADVFVLPSRSEGYGITVIEAMSAGLPGIVSGAGVLPEIVGNTGTVVEPVTAEGLASALSEMGTDRELRAARAASARARYERIWSRENTTGALGALYRRIALPRG